MKKPQGKIIVVTGGTSGIGRHIVGAFSEGNTVVNLARSCVPSDTNIRCDVSVAADVDAAFREIKQRYGRVDILINNAGYGVSGAVELLSDEEVERIFEVNFHGVFRCIKHALPLMQSGGKLSTFRLRARFFLCPSGPCTAQARPP